MTPCIRQLPCQGSDNPRDLERLGVLGRGLPVDAAARRALQRVVGAKEALIAKALAAERAEGQR